MSEELQAEACVWEKEKKETWQKAFKEQLIKYDLHKNQSIVPTNTWIRIIF